MPSMQRPPDAITDIIPPREGEFRIQLPAFEGPLDLLLHLIKKHELDILDLPISFITERYLEYLKLMEQLDLDVAAEYLLMAATLAHIKSKMLLPRTPEEQHDDGEVGEMLDPRADLIRRLLEYQKYKAAAESLSTRSIAGRDVFPRGSSPEQAEGPAPLADIALFKLLDAFESILKRTKDRSAFEITSERISIQERMTQIADLVRERGSCLFEELFAQDVTRYEVVITFLALLEMTKLRITRIYQSEYGASINVQYALLDASLPTIPPERDNEQAVNAPDIEPAKALPPEDAEAVDASHSGRADDALTPDESPESPEPTAHETNAEPTSASELIALADELSQLAGEGISDDALEPELRAQEPAAPDPLEQALLAAPPEPDEPEAREPEAREPDAREPDAREPEEGDKSAP